MTLIHRPVVMNFKTRKDRHIRMIFFGDNLIRTVYGNSFRDLLYLTGGYTFTGGYML